MDIGFKLAQSGFICFFFGLFLLWIASKGEKTKYDELIGFIGALIAGMSLCSFVVGLLIWIW